MTSRDPEKGVATEDVFPVSVEALCDLMKDRNAESLSKITDTYGGAIGLARSLGVDASKGLCTSDSEDIAKRERQFGGNVIPPKKPKSFLQLCWEACQDLTLIILICASIFSLVLALVVPHDPDEQDTSKKYVEYVEALAIMMAVGIVVLVTAGNDWSKERKFRGLQERISKEQHVDALRDGDINPLNVTDILVGDIVHVKYGDQVPADGLILQCNDLKIDESSMTGESDLIKKSVLKCPWLLAGTHVMEGSGRMLTIAVGKNSQTGIIFTLLGASGGAENSAQPATTEDQAKDKPNGVPKVEIVPPGATENGSRLAETDVDSVPVASTDSKKGGDDEEDETSSSEGGDGGGVNQDKSVLQTKLTKLTILIGKLGTAAAVLTVLVLIIRFVVNELMEGKSPRWSWLNEFVSHIIIGVTVLVVAVPEGLPLAVTISLAYSVKKMMKDNNLVRHLDACETMGSATTICSDKTGTLTKNRMTVTQIYAEKHHFKDIPKEFKPSQKYLDLLANAISINSGYTSQIIEEHAGDKHPKHVGNKTECGLLGLLLHLGASYHQIREKNPEDSFLKVYTFNSARKSMSTVVRLADGTKRLFTKGASETILKLCSFQLAENGAVEPISKKDVESIVKSVVEPMASDALRTLCIAYKDFPAEMEPDWEDEVGLVSQLTCIAVTGIEDPVRDEVPEAIKKCQKAGITVRMVTGDNIMTARSIATKCGIIRPGEEDFLVIEGREFNKRIRNKDGLIEQKLLDKVWPQLRVLARSSPTDKHTLVKGIIDSELPGASEVVAVTGDGTNDGPALKKADVGFAMGIAGTDVAKEASDIILTDDNFTSIVRAVMWGRNVYDGIAKFLQFQLTVNLVAIILAFTSSCIIMASPLKAIQLLWVNLIMDTFASLALATEMPTEDLLNRKPYGRTKPLISPMMARNIVGQAIYQLAVLYAILFAGPYFLPLGGDIEPTDFGRKAKVPNDHFTMVFNVFVLMQCFNEINARKIHGERNVFQNIHTNALFICIVIGTIIAQVVIVQFGDVITFTTPLGWELWLWSVAFGLGTLVWAQVLNFVPESSLPSWFSWGDTTEDYSNQEGKTGGAGGANANQPNHRASSTPGGDRGDADATAVNFNPGSSGGGAGGADNRSRVLWVRGVTRIQQQIKVVKAFRETVQPMRGTSRDNNYHNFIHKPVPVMGMSALMGYHSHYDSNSGTSTPTPSPVPTPSPLARHNAPPYEQVFMIDDENSLTAGSSAATAV